MIESAEIQNFRGFKQTELNRLSRINLIVGDNGVGKTALLEALFLSAANTAEHAVRFRVQRGSDAPNVSGTAQEIYDGLFGDLFYGSSRDTVASISLKGNAEDSRRLRIFFQTAEPTVLPFAPGQSVFPQHAYAPVAFEWMDSTGKITETIPRIQPGGLAFPPVAQMSHDAVYIAARQQFPTSQNAKWYSEYSKHGREKKFLEALQSQFEYIESLTVEVDMGVPVLFVKMPWTTSKVPVYLASDGLNKIITLLLSIAHATGTAVFVDEIENGLHHTRHEKMWGQLLTFAEEYGTQLFLSTHSWEFIKAGESLISQFPNDVSIIQVAQDDGVSEAFVVNGKDAAAAIKSGVDFRGAHRGSRSTNSHQ